MTADGDRQYQGGVARLWRLIEERTRSDADTAAIDARIWDLFGEQWAVMFTDLAGFSRQVAAFGIIHFLQVILEHKRLLLPLVDDHAGILVKSEADSLIVLFRRPAEALRCAVDMQRACQQVSQRRLPEEQIHLCVGIGYGKVLRVGDAEVFGVEVNTASRLGEDCAKAGEILCTEAAMLAAGRLPDLEMIDAEVALPGSERNYRVRYPA